MKLSVPLVVDYGIGYSWYEALDNWMEASITLKKLAN